MIRVVLPTQLETYTAGLRELSLDPASLGACDGTVTAIDVIQALDQRYPGLAFRIVDEQGRIRRHIAIFIGEEMIRQLDVPVANNDRLQIVGALSGG